MITKNVKIKIHSADIHANKPISEFNVILIETFISNLLQLKNDRIFKIHQLDDAITNVIKQFYTSEDYYRI